jgi:hypothetical protein
MQERRELLDECDDEQRKIEQKKCEPDHLGHGEPVPARRVDGRMCSWYWVWLHHCPLPSRHRYGGWLLFTLLLLALVYTSAVTLTLRYPLPLDCSVSTPAGAIGWRFESRSSGPTVRTNSVEILEEDGGDLRNVILVGHSWIRFASLCRCQARRRGWSGAFGPGICVAGP